MGSISCAVLADGDLEISADDEARADLADVLGKVNYWSILADLFEPYSANGRYTPFDAGDANPFVGLTNAPCIAESMDAFDNGERAIVGRLWCFLDYQVVEPLEVLRDTGRVVFTIVPQ